MNLRVMHTHASPPHPPPPQKKKKKKKKRRRSFEEITGYNFGAVALMSNVVRIDDTEQEFCGAKSALLDTIYT